VLGLRFLSLIINDSMNWDVAPCSLVEVCRRFEGTFFLHLQDQMLWQGINQVDLIFDAEQHRLSVRTCTASFPGNSRLNSYYFKIRVLLDVVHISYRVSSCTPIQNVTLKYHIYCNVMSGLVSLTVLYIRTLPQRHVNKYFISKF
jgi:hypothetical protein